MKVIEILKLSRIALEILQKSCVKIDDVRYIEMYEEYLRMQCEGYKKTYIVACLVEKYHVSERQVYYILNKFASDCNSLAVE